MKGYIFKFLLSVFLCILSLTGKTQTTILMEADGGVYKIPCTINGLRLKMIFDPGASNVCISESVAKMMLDNDYLSAKDIKGNAQSQVADGRIVDHTRINLKKVQIGDKVLTNVEAVVIHGQDAPLLFGQSALKRLGGYAISGNKLMIGINNPSHQSGGTVMKEEDVARILSEAWDAKSNGLYRVAIEKYKELYDYNLLEPLDVFSYVMCLCYTDEYSAALELLQAIQPTIESEYPDYKSQLYYWLADCYQQIRDYNAALLNYEKLKYISEPLSRDQTDAVISIAHIYFLQEKFYNSRKVLDDYISQYLYYKKINATDCWSSSSRATSEDMRTLATLYYTRALSNEKYNNDCEKYMILAAAWGSEKAMECCIENNVYFRTKPLKYNY